MSYYHLRSMRLDENKRLWLRKTKCKALRKECYLYFAAYIRTSLTKYTYTCPYACLRPKALAKNSRGMKGIEPLTSPILEVFLEGLFRLWKG